MRSIRHAAWLGAAILLALPARLSGQGGPPLITDDPDTPGPAHWEINFTSSLETSSSERSWDLPRIDLNYGVGRRIELTLELPWLVVEDRTTGGSRSGLGDAEAGIKWRFLGQEGKRLAWAISPQLSFNTDHASVTKGLVEPGHELLLPTEITIEWDHMELNAEVGRALEEHGPDEWIAGVSAEADLPPRLELLGELHGERTDGEPWELIANLGGRLKLTRRAILMLAAGHSVHAAEEDAHTRLLAGIQLNLPDQYSFK